MKVQYILAIVLLCLFLIFSVPTLTESSNLTINYDSPSTDQLTVVSQAESIILPFGDLKINSENIEDDTPISVSVIVTNTENSESYQKSYKINTSNSGSVGVPLAQDVIGSDKLTSSGFPVNQNTELKYEIQAEHPETETSSVSDTIDILVQPDPSSCGDILSNNQNPDNGNYIIDNNGNEFQVYCIFEPSGSLVADSYTMKYVENGKTTRSLSDDNTCTDYGMQLFVPRSPEEYDIAKNYVSNTYGKDPSNWDSAFSSGNVGGGLGPMGLYYTDTFVGPEDNYDSSQSAFTGKNVHSFHYGSNTIDEDTKHSGSGWLTFLDTDRFWIAGNEIDSNEPNGDYTPESWLGFEWSNNGDVSDFNDDQNNAYGYDSYLCTQQYSNTLA